MMSLHTRNSIDLPNAYEPIVDVWLENEEATKEDLDSLAVRMHNFTSKSAFKDSKQLFNFDLLYKGTKVDPEGIVGTGSFGVIAAFSLPNNKKIALKVEEEWLGANTISLDVMDKCPVQSPVKELTQPGCSYWSEAIGTIREYKYVYVMPLQSGDGKQLLVSLWEQHKAGKFPMKDLHKCIANLLTDLTRQVFCALREGILIQDAHSGNYLYRRTHEKKVRIMFTDWGLWRNAKEGEEKQTGDVITYGLLPIFNLIKKMVEAGLTLDYDFYGMPQSLGKLPVDMDAYSALRSQLQAAKQHTTRGNEPSRNLAVLQQAPAIAYYFNRVLNEHPTEVKLTVDGRLQFDEFINTVTMIHYRHH